MSQYRTELLEAADTLGVWIPTYYKNAAICGDPYGRRLEDYLTGYANALRGSHNSIVVENGKRLWGFIEVRRAAAIQRGERTG